MLVVLAVLGTSCTVEVDARAQQEQQEPAVLAGVQYLRGRAMNQQVGEAAMTALGMLKADVPSTDPAVASCYATIQKRFTGSGYLPQRTSGHAVYEAAVVAMALANMDSDAHRGEIGMVATYLIGRQNANGSWDYSDRSHGDTSISQYAVLGLWECENSGVNIPPSVWDRAASWYLSVQAPPGAGITTATSPSLQILCR